MKYPISFFLIYLPISLVAQTILQPNLNYPVIQKNNITEDYFGIQVTDPYRNLEDLENPNVMDWYNAQSYLADSVFSNISGRELLLKKFNTYGNRAADNISDSKITENGRYFYLKRAAGEHYSKLYFRENYNAKEQLVFDPQTYDSLESYTVSYFKPSWDGQKVAIALTHSGLEISDIIILDIEKRFRYPEILKNSWPDSFLGISWLPDNSGFIFLQFSFEDDGSESTASVLHRLGMPADSVVNIFGKQSYEALNADEVYPIATIDSKHAEYALGYLATVDNFWDAYITPLDDLKNGKPNWKPFYKKEDQAYTSEGQFYGDKYYYRTNKVKNSNTINVVNLPNSDFSNSEIYASCEGDEIIDYFLVTNSGICYTTSKYGTQAHLYESNGTRSKAIELPYAPGSIEMYQSNTGSPKIWIELYGWTSESDRYQLDLTTQDLTYEPLTTPVSFDEFDGIISRELLVEAYDGERIPVSLILKQDIRLDGNNPTLFYTYGAYGTSILPFYSPILLTWIELGGILCIPHVRGGGEKGELWHQQGIKLNKANSWKDLVDVTEYLIAKGYTSTKKTVIYSTSAGGITIGGAINLKPELFTAAIAEVPVTNPFRSENRADGGGANQDEYGSINDSLGVKGLRLMDPYLNIHKANYPAVLVTAGENDARVPLWMPGKYVARLQNNSTSGNPVLFRIQRKSGHEANAENLKMYEEYADVLSFAFWQTGHSLFRYED